MEHLAWSLGAPQYPGDELRLNGRITGVESSSPRGRVTVAVSGVNALGVHVNGKLRLSLPSK